MQHRSTADMRVSPLKKAFASSTLFRRILPVLYISAVPLAAQNPAIEGQWSPVTAWPYKAVHAHLLPTGKVMIWDSFAAADNARLWDPVTATFTTVPKAGANIFCTGHSFLPDGRLLVTGGHKGSFTGLPYTFIYDPFGNTWTRLPDMNRARWYPTNTTLANGDVLVLAGRSDSTLGMNPLPQIWEPATGTWRNLTTAQLVLPYYPYMYVAPDGKMFMAGPAQTTRYLDISGTGAWTTLASNRFGARNWGSSVMYDDGKILNVGGTQCAMYGTCSTLPPTKTAEVIDLNSPTPAWRYVGEMANARKHHNLTLLPDGTVLVTGGSRGTENAQSDSLDPAFETEVWDPATETWSKLASITVYRGYHATALLLPDGRVLSGGGEYGGAGKSVEIFSPPYLFKGARPTITSAAQTVNHGQNFFVGTPNAAAIAQVNLISLSTVTHTFNSGQRINRLRFSQTSGGLNVVAPTNGNVCPPGYYMLFIVDATGVPSIARMVRVEASVPALAKPTGVTAVATSANEIALTWTDTSDNENGFRVERSSDNITYTQMGTTGANVATYADTGLTSGTLYYYRVRAYKSDGDTAVSNTASATTMVSAPGAPTGLTATAASAIQIDLAWTDVSDNESGFRIERSIDNVTFAEIGTTGANVATYSNTGLTAGTLYYYRVRAYNSGGNSEFSNTASATTSASLPAGPVGLTATAVSATQINLTWTDASNNESGFRVERSSDNVTFAEIGTTAANVSTYSNTGLTTGTLYYYRVRAYNAAGNSEYSNTSSATTSTSTATPAQPADLTATAAPNRINLTWTDASNNESGFYIERSTDGVMFTQIAAVQPNTVAYASTGLAPGTLYYYRIRAYNASGTSPYSNTANAITPAIPAAPTGLIATAASSSRITLAWTDNSDNETGFRIERSTDNINFVEIATKGGNATKHNNNGLTPGTVYYYRVRAYNSAGNSAYSNTATATTR